MNLLSRLGKLLRVPTDEVEAVLRHDDKRARETVSRRRFMGAAAALASAPFVPQVWALPLQDKLITARWVEATAQDIIRDIVEGVRSTGELYPNPGTLVIDAAIERIVVEGTICP